MVTSFLHQIASYPVIYDWIQRLAGHEVIDEHLRRSLDRVVTQEQLSILDVGGGTGKGRRLWSSQSSYICLDNDPVKLSPLVRNPAQGSGLLADATRMPLGSGVFDVVVCCLVSHHISDLRFPFLLAECMRVLKKTGVFLFVDPVWDSTRPVGRLLWRYDRGSYPRRVAQLDSNLSQCGSILHREEFTTLHRFVLYLITKNPASNVENLLVDHNAIHS